MARQCMVIAILHRPEAKSSSSTKKCLYQLKTLVLLEKGSAKEAKREDLERVVVDNDSEKFFQVEVQLPSQEKK